MNIILEGIDLPKGEETEVIIRIQPNGDIKDEHGILLTEAKAIQIDRPHGRLIDADELRAKFRELTEIEWNQKASPVSWAYAYEDIIDLIDDAPTILESEE